MLIVTVTLSPHVACSNPLVRLVAATGSAVVDEALEVVDVVDVVETVDFEFADVVLVDVSEPELPQPAAKTTRATRGAAASRERTVVLAGLRACDGGSVSFMAREPRKRTWENAGS